MNFPLSRHLHRYEYIMNKGYVDDKTVIDIGSGLGQGTQVLSIKAKSVLGVEKERAKMPPLLMSTSKARPEVVSYAFFDFYKAPPEAIYDVGVAVEIFEHVDNPNSFVDKIATHCTWMFITTPLSDETKKTDNPEHVLEYSEKDFRKTLERAFHIEEFVYQMPDLSITDKAEYGGASTSDSHVVQMAWCRRIGR